MTRKQLFLALAVTCVLGCATEGFAQGVTLTTSGSPSLHNQTVTFTATYNGGDGPTGIYEFEIEGYETFNNINTTNGVATLGVSSLPVGTYSVTAIYSPEGKGTIHLTSNTITQTVNKGAPAITAEPTASTITWGQSLASATLSGGTASVTGTFTWTAPATIPPAGAQSESVTFTPSDTTDYTTVTESVSVAVNTLTLSSPTINTTVQLINGGGPALVPLGNGLSSKALELVYVNIDQVVALAYSTDGLHYTNVGPLTVPYGGGVAGLDCSPAWSDHCGVAAAEYNNQLYVAYNDISCDCLYVLAGTPIANTPDFTWTLAYTAQPAYSLETTPAMLKVQTGPTTYNLIIRYGTTEGDNEAYSSVFNGENGTWSTQDSNSTSRTQSTLFTVDGTNYAIDLSNPNDSGAINITELDDNGVAIPGTAYPLQNDSGNITQGFSSTVYSGDGNCVLVTSMPPAGNELQILSTSDYYSSFADGEFWGHQTYSNILEVPYESDYPGDFAMTVYPQQPSGSAAIVVAYSGDSNGDLYAASSGTAPQCP